METLGTEVRSFHSLRDMAEVLEEEMHHYRTIVEEYNQWLGIFLRDSAPTYGDQEWFKDLTGIQKALKAGKKTPQKAKKNEDKKKRGQRSTRWFPYKEIMVCADEQGQAEIVFEAIEEIDSKIDRLDRTRIMLLELEKSGLGTGITFIAYFQDGVPEKIVLRHKKGEELAERFKFITEISVPTSYEP